MEEERKWNHVNEIKNFLSSNFLFAIAKHAIKFPWNILCEKYVRKLKNAMKQKWFFIRIFPSIFIDFYFYRKNC